MAILKRLIKILNEHENYYSRITEIMRELQPLAFLISVSLVLAVFFEEDKSIPLSQKYALFASILFFLAYLGFAFYKITKNKILFYWGLALILIATCFIYSSFGNILEIVITIEDKNVSLIVSSVIYSLYIVATKVFLDFSKKNTFTYKVSKYSFYTGFLLIFIFTPLTIYLNFTKIPLLLGLILLTSSLFLSAINPLKQSQEIQMY